MNEKIIIGIIITCLLIVVGLLMVKNREKQSSINDLNKEIQSNKSSINTHEGLISNLKLKLQSKELTIDDLTSQVKKVYWLMRNQRQKFENSTLLTEEMSNCMFDKMISNVGLADLIMYTGFSPGINQLIELANTKNITPLPELTNYATKIENVNSNIMTCDNGKQCGVPAVYFGDDINADGTKTPACNYTL